MDRIAGLLALLVAVSAHGQAYKPSPASLCDYLAGIRAAPDRSNAALVPQDLMEKLGEARAACGQAVAEQPKAPRSYGNLARVLALSGDAAGAQAAARTGADLGSTTAQVILAVMLADGVHVPRDYAAAYQLLQRAAKSGSAYAEFNLGVLLANGWGVLPDDAAAAAAFRRAAQGGDSFAMQIVAQRYDKPRAEAWLKKAAEAMYPDALGNPLRIARLGAAQPDTAALVDWYFARAKERAPWAQGYIGILHEAGQWLRQDYAAAATWHRAAGEGGYVWSQYRMVTLHRDGRGVPRDESERRRWAELSQVQRCDAHEAANAAANACDRLASDRFDPDSASPGVDSFCMRRFAERAVAACTLAVKESPDTARYRSQLARALAHTGRFEDARREARIAADAGSTSAMILLGAMSARGLGAEQNESDADAWYRKAGRAGNPRGAALATKSSNVIVQTAPTLEEQAQKGNAHAQTNLAAELERQKRYDEAIAWYARAAAQGFRPAELNLAQMYEKGIGTTADSAEARRRYRQLAAAGDSEGRWRAAQLAEKAGDYAEAREYYEAGARVDHTSSIVALGVLYEEGRGVPADVRRAAGFYERAAEQSRWARYKLGLLYLEGKGNLAQDYPHARAWLTRAAKDGNSGARNNLGVMHERGLGMKVDYRAARDLYVEALVGGIPQAKGNLEALYASGRGAPSGAAALEWYSVGADYRIASAQLRLGRMYARGEGVPRSNERAFDLLMGAAAQGNPEAREEAAKLAFLLGQHFERRMFPPAVAWPTGFSLEAGDDLSRTIAVRYAGVAQAQAIGLDPSVADAYDVIRWFPQLDGKKQP